MKRALCLSLVLLTGLAFGQAGSTTRPRFGVAPASADSITQTAQGSATVAEATTADQTLYVDPTGSDSNACTATGASACLTIQGAFNKSPKLLRHQLTVNVAAGTYAGATISGFTIDPSVQRATAGIYLLGAKAAVTPTTGTATGTATAGTAGTAASATFSTMTDSNQTWTVNDAQLVGAYVVFTGGTGSGQQRVICSNTATVLTLCGTGTAATGTTTYSIQRSSVTINVAAAAIPKPQTGAEVLAAGIQVVDNVTGGSRITIQDVTVAINGTAVTVATPDTVELVQVSSTGTGGITGTNARLTLTTCSITGATAGVSSSGGTLSATNMYVRAGSATTALSVSSGGSANSGAISGEFDGVVGVQVQRGSSSAQIGPIRCDCQSLATSACLIAGTTAAVSSTTFIGAGGLAALVGGGEGVTNCTAGIVAASGGTVFVASTSVVSGNALGNAVDARQGGAVYLPTAATTITGATAETSLDNGAATATFASYPASFNCLTNLATGSRVCRQ